jgi:MerR family transcriptional regulator, light-induced transcriptional regulator
MPDYRIAAVSRLTGLPADTIRKWEHRYGVVRPRRDARDLRRYTEADLDRLRLLAAAVKIGISISEASALTPSGLAKLVTTKSRATLPPSRPRQGTPDAFTRAVLRGLERSDGEQIDRMLTAAARLLPTSEFVFDVMSPLFKTVGESWRRGTMDVAQEHLFSAIARSVVGNVMRRYAAHERMPLVAFTTPAGEPHEFGILLAALLAASEGLRVRYLGPDMPAASVARGASDAGARAVVVGAVRSRNAASLGRALKGIVDALPPTVDLWLGGKAAYLAERWDARKNVVSVATLQDFHRRIGTLLP